MAQTQARKKKAMRSDVYERITGKIVEELEKGVRPWPWNAGNTDGRMMRPLRANGIPYRGIDILMLWAEALEKGFGAPIWMTFKQALELDAHVKRASAAAWSSMLRNSPAPKPMAKPAKSPSAISRS
jgi:antirestriction protein ArdC